MIGMNGNPAGSRRGLSGDGDRPWLAVWMMLLDRALESAAVPAEVRPRWKAAAGAFLLEFHRHPAHIPPEQIREWLFRTGELGGAPSARSLPTAMEALVFFYTHVVPRPSLADAARHPFEGGPLTGHARPDWGCAQDRSLLGYLMQKLTERKVANLAAAPKSNRDWSAA